MPFPFPPFSYLFFYGKLSCAQSHSSRTSFIIYPSHSITIIPHCPCGRHQFHHSFIIPQSFFHAQSHLVLYLPYLSFVSFPSNPLLPFSAHSSDLGSIHPPLLFPHSLTPTSNRPIFCPSPIYPQLFMRSIPGRSSNSSTIPFCLSDSPAVRPSRRFHTCSSRLAPSLCALSVFHFNQSSALFCISFFFFFPFFTSVCKLFVVSRSSFLLTLFVPRILSASIKLSHFS